MPALRPLARVAMTARCPWYHPAKAGARVVLRQSPCRIQVSSTPLQVPARPLLRATLGHIGGRRQLPCRGVNDEVKSSGGEPGLSEDSTALPNNFCIIESPTAVKDFADMQLSEVRANIEARRNRIFLLMEEVRRLRIQERLKLKSAASSDVDEAFINEEFPSALPFAPPLNSKTIQQYYFIFGGLVLTIILFGGLVSPILEVRLGLGGQSYADFIDFLHLPKQLSQVDPIVASFCGGAVGVLTSLLIVEENNVKRQAKARCAYCEGTGYITCGNCFSSGVDAGSKCMCATCSGTGKVACTACLCTGKMMATEHDPRIDPFD